MYCKGYIYKVICKVDDSICYIGSTFDQPRKRWQGHKDNYKQYLNGKKRELSIYKYFDKYGIDNFQLIKIKSYICYRESKNDFKHLHAWETLWISKSKTAVNERLPFNPLKKIDNVIREKEYYNNNKDTILKKQKEYYGNNTAKVKEYYNNNKDSIKQKQREYSQQPWYCICCDKTITRGSKFRHLTSAKHILKSKCIII